MKLITLVKNAKEIIKVPHNPQGPRGYTIYRYERVGDLPQYYMIWADRQEEIPLRLAPVDIELWLNCARKTPGATVDIREGEF